MKEKLNRIINYLMAGWKRWKKNTGAAVEVLKRWGRKVKKVPLYFKIGAVYLVVTLLLTGIFLWKAKSYYPEIPLGKEESVKNAHYEDEDEKDSRPGPTDGDTDGDDNPEAVTNPRPDGTDGADGMTDVTTTGTDKTVNIELLWPVEGGADNVETEFGEAINFNSKGVTNTRIHKGIDICVPEGTAVIASAEGEVIEVKKHDALYGTSVLIKHVDDVYTFYGSLAEITVQPGDGVEGGRIIGRVGRKAILDSGLDRPYLHFEMRLGQKSVDPLKYLP